MDSKDKLPGEIQKFAAVLALSQAVHRLDGPEEPGAWRVAYALTEIRESIAKLEGELLPELLAATDATAVDTTLNEIGEQLRHLLYHVKDSGYFDYLIEDGDSDTECTN